LVSQSEEPAMNKTSERGESGVRKRNAAVPVGADKGKVAATKTQPPKPGTGSEPAVGSPSAPTPEPPRSVQSDDAGLAARNEAPVEGRRDLETDRRGRNTDIERG
jgi:hypothetical protein